MKNQRNNPYGRIMLSVGFFSLCLSALLSVWLLATFLPPTPDGTMDVTVPQLTGEAYQSPDPRLPEDIYDVIVEYRTDGVHAAGTVLSQSPPSGAVRRVLPSKRRCALHLVVSAGEPCLTLPDLLGQAADIATLHLQQLGLTGVRQLRRSSQFSAGQVIEMQPAAGTNVHPGDTVTLIESTTATVRTLAVPDVMGLEEQVAAQRLRGAGLVPSAGTYAPSELPRGTVISQFPLSGTIVVAGTHAELTLSDGSLTPPPEQSPGDVLRGENGASESMPGSPQSDISAPDASQYEDEISPPLPRERKKSNWFGWFS
jgi:serine/threonine-protein kinase